MSKIDGPFFWEDETGYEKYAKTQTVKELNLMKTMEEQMTKINRQEALAQEAREKVRKPLTDEQIDKAWEWAQRSSPIGVTRLTVFARAIERAHGIGVEDEPDSSVT